MSTSPDFFKHRETTAVRHPAAPHNATNGDGHGAFGTTADVRTERRRRPPLSSLDEYLHALPASILLDRLLVPMLAVGLDGVVVYANPAFATMLGHQPDTTTLTGQWLSSLLAGRSADPPRDCVSALRAASNVVLDWLHVEGFPVRSVVSETLFFRATDQVLLLGITDISELIWNTRPEPR